MSALAGGRVWVADDDRSIRWVLDKALSGAGCEVTGFADGEALLAALEGGGAPDVVVSDIRMPGLGGLALLEAIGRRRPGLPVVIMTAFSDLESTVAAYEGGAFEYLAKPFDVDEAVAIVRRALRRAREGAPRPDSGEGQARAEILGSAPAMQGLFRAIGRLARARVTVLVTGESGTGKELVARALHRHGPRSGEPFIAINSAAIPRELLESELFGHERGAFTGAQARRIGRFEQADGGTLFLDEIGDMPADLQTRLLRVLSDGQFYRVGGHHPVRVDVRVIAATHQDLEARVREGRFREDLYHRLNVIRVQVPALRERREDIALLARHFLERAAAELGTEVKTLAPEVEAHLRGLDWPGNVRQLENLCRWLTVMAPGGEVHLEDLPPELAVAGAVADGEEWPAALRRWAEGRLAAGGGELLGTARPLLERTLIEVALAACAGRRAEAARLLGWGRNTLTRKLRELGMSSRRGLRDDRVERRAAGAHPRRAREWPRSR